MSAHVLLGMAASVALHLRCAALCCTMLVPQPVWKISFSSQKHEVAPARTLSKASGANMSRADEYGSAAGSARAIVAEGGVCNWLPAQHGGKMAAELWAA